MAKILLFGIIGDNFDNLDAATVTAAIRGSTGPLAVRINSPGGYVMEGLAIIAALRDYREKVMVYIDGFLPDQVQNGVCFSKSLDAEMTNATLIRIERPQWRKREH